MRRLFHLATCAGAWLAPDLAVAANECPSAASGRGSYVIERSGSSKTEVFYGDGPIVRTVMQSGGRVLLETTQHEGLFQLDRIDRGQRTVFKPKSDLAKLFPLRPKQKMDVVFDTTEAGAPPYISSVKLAIVGTDSLSIGNCKYDVLRIEHTDTRRGQSGSTYVDWYAPELKFVIAKEWPERNGRTTLIKFDRIMASEATPPGAKPAPR
jgi:hypothetical protein